MNVNSMYFCNNKFEVGVNDRKFTADEKQNVYD